jgi:hypothetical protein
MKTNEKSPPSQESRHLVETREVEASSAPFSEDRWVHGEEAHRAVYERSQRMVVEKACANGEEDPVRQAVRDELSCCGVEVEKRAMVGYQNEAACCVQRRQAFKPVNFSQSGNCRANPPLSNRSLK